MWATLPSGRDLIVVGQKSGVAYALDPDRRGEQIWRYRAGGGSGLGGRNRTVVKEFKGVRVKDGLIVKFAATGAGEAATVPLLCGLEVVRDVN